MANRLDYDRVAAILVEAVYFGEKETAKRWGVTDRTILNYRNRLTEDTQLSDIFALKKEIFEREWASEIPAAIKSAVRFLMNASTQVDPKSPDAIHAVAGALKILAEVGLTKEIIDVRLGRYNRPGREEDTEVASLPPGTDPTE